MKILGISAYYHDSAAALLHDGALVAAAQEERFSRKKHDARFPGLAIAYCLEEIGIEISDLDHIVFYDKPLLKFERLLETYFSFAPKGLQSFTTAMPMKRLIAPSAMRSARPAIANGFVGLDATNRPKLHSKGWWP